MRKRALLGGLLGMIAIATPAFAVPYNGSNVYKATQGGRTYVFISGTTQGTPIEVSFDGVQRTSIRSADACGQVVVPQSSTAPLSGTVQIGNQSINYDTAPTQLKPSCVNGVLSEARSAAYKTPEGALVGVGFPASAPQNVITTGPRVRRVTPGACFARFTGTTSIPLDNSTTFTYNGTSYTVSSLPDAQVGPRQATVDGTARCFKPSGVASW